MFGSRLSCCSGCGIPSRNSLVTDLKLGKMPILSELHQEILIDSHTFPATSENDMRLFTAEERKEIYLNCMIMHKVFNSFSHGIKGSVICMAIGHSTIEGKTVGISDIAEMTTYDRRTVRRFVEKLMKDGLVEAVDVEGRMRYRMKQGADIVAQDMLNRVLDLRAKTINSQVVGCIPECTAAVG